MIILVNLLVLGFYLEVVGIWILIKKILLIVKYGNLMNFNICDKYW